MSSILCYHCGIKLVPNYRTKLSFYSMLLKHGDTCALSFGIRLPCSFCSYRGKYKYHFKSHVRLHLDIKPYACQYCGRKFAHKSSRDAHELIHLDVKPYECLKCGQNFRTLFLIRRHTMCEHHGIRAHLCTFCNNTYKDRKTLDNHILKHVNLKPLKCTYDGCNLTFRQASNLKSHIRTVHTGERPFQCKYCASAFKERHHLESHLDIHLGKNHRYVCNHCNYSAAIEWNVIQHRRIHTGERPFNCSFCPQNFRQKIHANNHMIVIHKAKNISKRKIL